MTDWTPFLPDEQLMERLTAILIQRLIELPEQDQQTIAQATLARTSIRRDPDGWLDIVVDADETVIPLGQLHVSVLERDAFPGSVN